jgi:hypothetical protein
MGGWGGRPSYRRRRPRPLDPLFFLSSDYRAAEQRPLHWDKPTWRRARASREHRVTKKKMTGSARQWKLGLFCYLRLAQVPNKGPIWLPKSSIH